MTEVYDRTEHAEDCAFNKTIESPVYGTVKLQKTKAWYKTFSKTSTPACPGCGAPVDAD